MVYGIPLLARIWYCAIAVLSSLDSPFSPWLNIMLDIRHLFDESLSLCFFLIAVSRDYVITDNIMRVYVYIWSGTPTTAQPDAPL